ncbi:MAG: glycosyltransferase [Deltaproteobacteria bacterium]|nr:glycosyltransferase [Deltaproteobacteria bacterium]
MNLPLVSILIRTKDRPESLAQAIVSVIAQTYRPLQLVVVNDGGQEISPDHGQRAAQAGVEFVYRSLQPWQGRSSAANLALETADGQWLLFLDDDDLLLPEHIASLVQVALDHPEAVGAYADVQCVSFAGGELALLPGRYDHEFDPLHLAVENFLPIHAVLFHRRVLEAGCRFVTSLTIYEDWHFWLQVTRLGPLIHHPRLGAYYRVDYSGVGEPGSERDFNAEFLAFMHAAKHLWSDAQLLYFVRSVKNLQNCQQQLTENNELRDEGQRAISRLEQHLCNLTEESSRRAEQHTALQQQLAQFRAELNYLRTLRVVRLNSRLREAVERWRGRRSAYRRRVRTFFRLLKAGEFREIFTRGQRLIGFTSQPGPVGPPPGFRSLEDGVVILATRHTQYVARLIQDALAFFGYRQVTILDRQPDSYGDGLHIVVCPQMFAKLPSVYIVFQMEQSVSSRWFTADYLRILERSLAILDYSLANIRFLQENGLSYKQIFWAPISNITGFCPLPTTAPEQAGEPEYDVVFYGDSHNPRRAAFLEAIASRFRLLTVSEVFGEELYRQLRRARVVINIHYYEQALLETTRIFECLSLGLVVVSEEGSDMADHDQLRPFVTFTPVGDVAAMLTALEQHLQPPRPLKLALLPADLNHFRYYFGRMLAAMDLMSFERLLPMACLTLQQFRKGIGLSLPETFERFDSFRGAHPELAVFHGLRHHLGWIGCAMSFKYLCHHALQLGLPWLEVFEDDVLMDSTFQRRRAAIQHYLFEGLGQGRWDIFCGLIADVSDQTRIFDVVDHDGLRLVTVDRMTSMVYNIYGPQAMQAIAAWNPDERDVHANAIDRYLEQRVRLRVVTVVPFCVGHRSELSSTLWHFQNSTYDEMILQSQQRLEAKVERFLAARKIEED